METCENDLSRFVLVDRLLDLVVALELIERLQVPSPASPKSCFSSFASLAIWTLAVESWPAHPHWSDELAASHLANRSETQSQLKESEVQEVEG